jgi:hypothetical protein
VSPPAPPAPPSFWKARFLKVGLPGLILLILCVPILAIALAALVVDGKANIGIGVIVPATVGAFLLWHGWPPSGSLSNEKYQSQFKEYQAACALYEKLWVCLSCGHIFKP